MSPASPKGRERQEKILLAIYTASGGTTRFCPYEDIVVQAWRLWPEEFGLRGYVNDFPDSSDLHKPLYGPMKREGLVRSADKKFGLTERGLAVAERLSSGVSGSSSVRGRLERAAKDEIFRLIERPAIQMITTPDSLLDTDLYDFYGVTVRTSEQEFRGRVRTVNAAIDEALKADDPSVDADKVAAVIATRDVLSSKFNELIAARTAVKSKVRS